jgi:hypothetical protein
MALSELAAFESAYQALEPLDAAGRRRALQWLSDALNAAAPLAVSPGTSDRSTEPPPAASSGSTSTSRGLSRRRAKRGKPASATPAPATKARRTRAAAETSTRGARAYRRMPPADEVMTAYEQIGTVSGLAEHFDVPGHTAQGWARQLRRQGYAIGRSR